MQLIDKMLLTIGGVFPRTGLTSNGKMDSNERSCLLAKSGFEAVCINITDPDRIEKIARNSEDYAYYEAQPFWIKLRLCLFWLFWAIFVTIVILFVLIYWCIVPSLCPEIVHTVHHLS